SASSASSSSTTRAPSRLGWRRSRRGCCRFATTTTPTPPRLPAVCVPAATASTSPRPTSPSADASGGPSSRRSPTCSWSATTTCATAPSASTRVVATSNAACRSTISWRACRSRSTPRRWGEPRADLGRLAQRVRHRGDERGRVRAVPRAGRGRLRRVARWPVRRRPERLPVHERAPDAPPGTARGRARGRDLRGVGRAVARADERGARPEARLRGRRDQRRRQSRACCRRGGARSLPPPLPAAFVVRYLLHDVGGRGPRHPRVLACQLRQAQGRLARRLISLLSMADEHGGDAADEHRDELPADLDAAGYVGPYAFPNVNRRRVPGTIYLVIAVACLLEWVTHAGS